jgi:uncharacterized coiled-coil DUF342 family protein
MDTRQIPKQMIEFNKTTFDHTFEAIIALQDQTEKFASSFIEKAAWLPEESRKAINEWIKVYKKGRDDFKCYADDNYEKMVNYFAKAEKEEPLKKVRESYKQSKTS